MLKRRLVWFAVAGYVLLSIYLFFHFPDAEVNVRQQSAWMLGMTLAGATGVAFSVMPVAGVIITLRSGRPGLVRYAPYPAVISLSLAAMIYLLRLFSCVMVSPLCLAFLFLAAVTAVFLWHFCMLLLKSRE